MIFNYAEMNFKILKNCTVCNMLFDTDYKLMKHMSKIHYNFNSLNDEKSIEKNHLCNCGSKFHS